MGEDAAGVKWGAMLRGAATGVDCSDGAGWLWAVITAMMTEIAIILGVFIMEACFILIGIHCWDRQRLKKLKATGGSD
jgi:hypothetical protein